MSNPYAVIYGGVVVNVALWDGETPWQPTPSGATLYALAPGSPIGIGWTYSGGVFTAPAPAATALLLNEAEGAFAGSNQILAVIQANRGYLEAMRK